MARHATSTEIINIAKLLDQHLKKVSEGIVEYLEGYDDKRIAAAAGQGISPASVARVRQENYGKLIVRSGDARIASAEELALNTSVAHDQLRTEFNDLRDKYNKLIVTLAMNHVANVKHLRSPDGARVPELKAV